jgi:hypothetical protein
MIRRVGQSDRFSPPWTSKNWTLALLFASGHKLAHVYFDDEPGRRSAAKLLKRCTSRKCNTPQ